MHRFHFKMVVAKLVIIVLSIYYFFIFESKKFNYIDQN